MRSNKLLFFFLGLFALFCTTFVVLIKSQFLSQIASQEISKVLNKKFGINLSFNAFKLNLIPAGLEMEDVVLSKENNWGDTDKIVFKARKVSVTFNTFDFFSSKFSIKQFKVDDSQILINGILKEQFAADGSEINLADPKSYLRADFVNFISLNDTSSKFNGIKYQEVRAFFEKKLPVVLRGLRLDNTRILIDGYPLTIREFSFQFYGSSLDLKFSLSSVLAEKLAPIKVNIDEAVLKVKVSANQVKIHEVKINAQSAAIKAQGVLEGTQNPIDTWTVKSDVNIQGELLPLSVLSKLDQYLMVKHGHIQAEGDLRGKLLDPDFRLTTVLNNFDFKYLIGERSSFILEKKSSTLLLSNFMLKHDDGLAKLNNQVAIYDLKQKQLLPDLIQLSFENLHSNTFLHFIKKEMEIMRGRFSGQAKIQYKDKNILIDINDNMSVKELRVIGNEALQNNRSSIVEVENFLTKNATFNYNLNIHRLDLSLQVQGDNFSAKVHGMLDQNIISIETEGLKADLEKMGLYGGQVIKGKGDLKLKVFGPLKNAKMNLTSSLITGLSYLDYHFDHASADMDIDFHTGELNFKKIEGKTGKSDAVLMGTFLPKTLELNLTGEFKESFYHDILKILHPLVKDLTFLPEDAIGTVDAKFKIGGNARPEEVVVAGAFSSANINIFNEDFNSIRTEFIYKNKTFELSKIAFKKGEGTINGKYSYDGKDKSVHYKFLVKDVILSEIQNYNKYPLGLNGILSMDVIGSNIEGQRAGKGKIRVSNSTILNIRVADSFLNYDLKNNIGSFYAELFKGGIILKSTVDFSEKKESVAKKSTLNFFVGSDDLNLFTGLFFAHNAKTKKIRGRINTELKANFNWNDWATADASLVFNELFFFRKNVDARIDPEKNKIIVKNGRIRDWHVLIKGTKFQFGSNAEGDLHGAYKIKNFLDFDGSLLEVLSQDIQGASGQLSNQFIFKKDANGQDFFSELYSNSFSLSHATLPGAFENLNLKISVNNNHFLIESFKGKFANGKVNVSGDFVLKAPHPEFNLAFSVDNSFLTFLKKSTFLVTGEGVLSGTNPPYNLAGNFILARAQIFDELSEFSGSSKTTVTNKYIPQSVIAKGPGIFNFNVAVDGLSDIQVKNSLGEMKLRGNVKFLGSSNQIRMGGQLNLVPGSGKFYFKTNDFLLNKGSILFFPGEESINPEINFAAKSRISEYDVELKIYGRAKKYSLDLASEPALPQEDIFSLLAVGFTEDVSRNIGDKDRQSLTGVGIGSLIFDKFKIGQELSSSLGVKLSVAPELVEANSSVLTNKEGDISGPASRLRTTTKVKLQKNITDALDISVSSSVGGSVGQRQEMNLNYSLNKNVSVLGVYEVRTDDDTEDSLNTSSMGGDLKLKWTFK